MRKMRSARKVLIHVASVVLVVLLAGAAYATDWSEMHGGTGDDYATSVRETSDGGYVVAGSTTSFGVSGTDVWVLKLTNIGSAQWQKTYGGTGDEYATSVRETSDGGCVVGGYSTSFGVANHDGWVLKLNSSGNVQWQKTYGGTGNDYVNSVGQTSDGGYIVAGYTNSFGVTNNDAWVMKLDNNGVEQWRKTYGGTGNDYVNSVEQTSDEGYIVAGHTSSFGVTNNDMWVVKLNSNGNVQWQKTYGGTGSEYANSVGQTSDGGYIVAGYTSSFGVTNNDAWMLKLDGNGDVAWQKTYGGTGSEYANSVGQTSDGGYIVAGYTSSFGVTGYDVWMLKLDDNGDVAWQKTYGGTGSEYANSVEQTSDGGYIVAGYTSSFGVANNDVWTLKLTGSGDVSGCASIIATTAASITTPSVSTAGSSATVATPGVTVNVSTAAPQNTNATATIQCSNITYGLLTLSKAGEGTGVVTSSPGGIDCGSDCSESFSSGTVVTLATTVDSDSVFAGWSGGGCTGTEMCVLAVTADTTVTATFDKAQYTLTLSKAGGGSGVVTSSPAGIDCGSDCAEDYEGGTVVTLTAAAEPNSVFAGWSGGGCTGTGTCTITMNAATTVTATFGNVQHTLAVSKAGGGSGVITSSPAGIDCGSDCSEIYNAGTVITLTAVAEANSVFAGWSGGGCSGAGTCMLTLAGDTSVTATFTRSKYTVTVLKAGTGNGSVTSADSGIDCGAACVGAYAPGSVVTLTAVAEANSVFAGWSGSGCAGTGTCTVIVSEDTVVNATFTRTYYELDVSKTGTGSGSVTSSDFHISCGSDCASAYPPDTVVTLSARADVGSVFAGWSGGGCSGTGTCVVSMTDDVAVSAAFTKLNKYVLNVDVIPGGGVGIVTGGGINCPGADCAYAYDPGTVVTLNVSEIADYAIFSHWEGCDSLSGMACGITMNSDRKVAAIFDIKSVGFSPDLTGEWMPLTRKCANAKEDKQCRTKGQLRIRNIGAAKAKRVSVNIYLSDDNVLDQGDMLLKTRGWGTVRDGRYKTKTFGFSSRYGSEVTGKYLIAVVSTRSDVDELYKANNIIVSAPIP